MVANKHISKIIIAVTAAAVILCFAAIAFSGKLTEAFGGTGVRMEYESKLFDTDEIISIDIRMDEETWNTMLSNAISEEYYVCDVVINGKRLNNVAIRPKGNTSLSAIAMDPDSDRYSLKLEFDHFVDGQTCYGLDKLILNNNYADATNMKEAIIYDMYQYIGADASLYNYAEVSLNGEYWGVYLALEGVEESFMLRNFGTQDGELYKPDSMEMGGGDSSASGNDAKGDGNSSPGGGFSFDPGNMPGGEGFSFDPENMPGGEGFSFDPENMPGGEGFSFDPNNMPGGDGSGFNPGNMSGGGFSFDPNNMPGNSGSESDTNNIPDNDSSGSDSKNASDNNGSGGDSQSRPDRGDFSPSDMGGFSMGGGGANLNYTNDDLDSYSTVWEGEITGTGTADHRRVVTALKNISEGTDLETYLDVDNILKYMAVHTFAVNMDSLSGSMAHNYYLYEYDGQLNLFPWDYNLSFGGMSMGSDADATDVVNDAIDTPFSGTKFFDALLSNEEYLEKYHAYLQQLADEYVNGGRFDEVYDRIRSQIDRLVETDPTAFYSGEEYQTAVQLLYETVKLRAESIEGQLNGTIPSTDAGQRQDSSALIDASHIDIKAMGQFNMGGSFGGGSDKNADTSDVGEGSDTSSLPGGFDTSSLPEGFDTSNLPEGFSTSGTPESSERDNTSENSDQTSTRKERPASFSGMPGQSPGMSSGVKKNAVTYGICLAVMIAALFIISRCKRRK